MNARLIIIAPLVLFKLTWAQTPAPTPVMDPVVGPRFFYEEIERDIPLKKQLPLVLVHSGGDVSIQGWVQDRIRVKIKKRVMAEEESRATDAFRNIDLLTLETPRAFEMRMGLARGRDLVSKLHAQKANAVEVSLEIRAPYQLALTLILGTNRDYLVQQWRGPVELRAKDSAIRLNRISSRNPMRISGLGCQIEVIDSEVIGHILASSQPVVLRDVKSSSLSVETLDGDIRGERVDGKFSLTTHSGKIQFRGIKGDFTFLTDTGAVSLSATEGAVAGETNEGKVWVETLNPQAKISVETRTGDVQTSLPAQFEGRLDLSSLNSDTVIQFPFEKLSIRGGESIFGPPLPGRVMANVAGGSTGNVRVSTRKGGIRILRQTPSQR